jgi:hypothetical protein
MSSTCPQCKKSTLEHANYCGYCGADLVTSRFEKVITPQPAPSPAPAALSPAAPARPFGLGWVIAAVGVLLCMVIFAFSTQKTNATSPTPIIPTLNLITSAPVTVTPVSITVTPTATATKRPPVVKPRPASRPDPAQFIKDYYAAINNRNYEYAFSRLSDYFIQGRARIQGRAYQIGDYEAFWNTVKYLDTLSATTNSVSSSSAELRTRQRYNMYNGQVADHTVDFYLIADPHSNSWLINITVVIN